MSTTIQTQVIDRKKVLDGDVIVINGNPAIEIESADVPFSDALPITLVVKDFGDMQFGRKGTFTIVKRPRLYPNGTVHQGAHGNVTWVRTSQGWYETRSDLGETTQKVREDVIDQDIARGQWAGEIVYQPAE